VSEHQYCSTEEIMRCLGRMEGTLDALRESVTVQTEVERVRLNDHANRIRGLERAQAWAAGVMAVLAAVVTAVFTATFDKIMRLFV